MRSSIGTLPRRLAPMVGWARISIHSSSVSSAGLERSDSGTPILPTSWKSAPSLIAAISSAPSPSLDRKSTRLNSSHVRISYAVFCLKKKKKQSDEDKSLKLNLRLRFYKRTDERPNMIHAPLQ